MFKQETKLSVKKYDLGLKACTILLSRLLKNVKVACRLFLHQFLVSKKICPQKYISIHNFKRNYNKFTKFQALFYKKKYFPDKKISGGKGASGGACHVVAGGERRRDSVFCCCGPIQLSQYTYLYTVANQRNNFSNKYGSNFIQHLKHKDVASPIFF